MTTTLPPGDWMQSLHGQQIWLLNMKPEQVRLSEIAIPLSRIPRFLGHTREFYSVAQHSVLVSRLAESEAKRIRFSDPPCHSREKKKRCDHGGPHDFMGHTCYPDTSFFALAGLLHDAHEAYIGDIATPVKRSLAAMDYSGSILAALGQLAIGIDLAITNRFGLPKHAFTAPAIKRADRVALATEAHDLMADPPSPWGYLEGIEPADERIIAMPPEQAEKLFRDRFMELTA